MRAEEYSAKNTLFQGINKALTLPAKRLLLLSIIALGAMIIS